MDPQPPHARAAGLHEVLATEKLAHRPSRPPQHEAENRALQALAQELAATPGNLLRKLVETVLDVCRADSAGISIHVPDEGVFRWDAVAGRLAPDAVGTLPRDRSPCGTVIDRDAVLLFDRPHRHFTALAGVEPPFLESLVAPFHLEGRPAGTLWAIGHTPERGFDAEDARLLGSLSRFASAGYRLVGALDEAAAARDRLDEEVRERRRAEEALRWSEERFRALVTASSDVVYRMSPDWSEMRHLQGREFIADTHEPSRTWLEKYIPPEDRETVVEAIHEAIRTRSNFELEHRVVRVDGTVGWTFSRAIPLLDADGEIVEWFGAAGDVTRRRETAEALRLSQAEAERQKRLYEAILSSTPDLVYVFDLDYRFTFANHALLQMWGRTIEDSIGKGLLEIGYEPWHAEMHEREIDRIVATGEPIRGEVAFPHATLGRRVYDYIFVPVLGAEGRVEAIAGTTRDVTERKRTEEELREAKHLAEAASQAKSQFLATMSHELRTPLTGVIGFAELVEGEVLGPVTARQREALSRIKASSWHLVSIIDEILTLSRAEAGKEEVRREEADVAAIVREVVQILEPQADARGLALRLEGAREPLPLWTDPGKVRQILLNLVGNAVKYTERGGITVGLDGPDPAWIGIHIRDTGPGIAEGDQERIFEPFTQADSSHTRAIGGTGLGLAISRKLARLLGGEVLLRSVPGEGSTFTLRLPSHDRPG
ncbi:MAG: PAS domain-containing protein [Gemmatimonadetes bacterium]|nr:PAS domain-containing protein [Gemmatimonadota bacterium]